MAEFDLVVRNGRVVTAQDDVECDIGVKDGRVAMLGRDLPRGKLDVDATGRLVLPGGVDSHCHIEQLSSAGIMNADDFHSGTVSAAFGGTTTVIPFAAQHRGKSAAAAVEDYRRKAGPKAVIDYAFHLILTDPTAVVMREELPRLIREGITSLKVYMTYELMKLDDYSLLEVLTAARSLGALTMIHAENHDVIRWMGQRLLERGHTAPKYHAIAHARAAEGEATHRAIRLAELADAPVLIVHVSAAEAMEEIRAARARGLKVFGETCPQYLFLTAKDLDRAGYEGAKFCCSPPPRDEAAQEAIWRGLRDGTFQIYSSDHAPYKFDASGKLWRGPTPTFKEIPMGIPGLELRMPLLFSEGVGKGRLTLQQMVSLGCTEPARLYGLYPRKGTIAVGSDADLAIWNPERRTDIVPGTIHDNTGYSPYEGRTLIGWPDTVVCRGRTIVQEGKLVAERGSGTFLPCEKPGSAVPLGRLMPELDPERNFGAKIL
jgi:dihydropyrimidinase